MISPDHRFPYFAWIDKYVWNVNINSINAESDMANVTVSEGCPFVIKAKGGFDYSGTGNITLKNIRMADKVRGFVVPLPIDIEILKNKFRE